MKYDAVLFDMDGVILDSEPVHMLAFQKTLKTLGLQLDEDDYKKYFAGKTDQAGFIDYFKEINRDFNLAQTMQAKTNLYLRLAVDNIVAYPGIVSLIKTLSASIPLALVTGSLRIEADIALQTLGLTDCFKFVISADDVTQGKPSPEGYKKATNLLNLPTKNCTIVEDSPSGIKAARSAGIHCIAITNTHTKDELGGADLVVESLSMDLF